MFYLERLTDLERNDTDRSVKWTWSSFCSKQLSIQPRSACRTIILDCPLHRRSLNTLQSLLPLRRHLDLPPREREIRTHQQGLARSVRRLASAGARDRDALGVLRADQTLDVEVLGHRLRLDQWWWRSFALASLVLPVVAQRCTVLALQL
jgi:hypothetical protein